MPYCMNMPSLCRLFAIVVLFNHSIESIEPNNEQQITSQLEHSTIFINSSFLSVTSTTFNPKSLSSLYIDRIFGYKSVFLRGERVKLKKTDPQTFIDIVSDSNSLIQSFDSAQTLIQKRYEALNISFKSNGMSFTDGNEFLHGFCSFEILGYTALGKDRFFKSRYRNIGPSIGRSTLNIDIPGERKDSNDDDHTNIYIDEDTNQRY